MGFKPYGKNWKRHTYAFIATRQQVPSRGKRSLTKCRSENMNFRNMSFSMSMSFLSASFLSLSFLNLDSKLHVLRKCKSCTPLLILPILLTGCSFFSKSSLAQNHDKSYLSARSIPPLKVPPGINSTGFHSAYPVSSREYPLTTEDVSVSPPGLNR